MWTPCCHQTSASCWTSSTTRALCSPTPGMLASDWSTLTILTSDWSSGWTSTQCTPSTGTCSLFTRSVNSSWLYKSSNSDDLHFCWRRHSFSALIIPLQGVCSQLEHSVISLVTSPGLEEAATDLATSLLNRSVSCLYLTWRTLCINLLDRLIIYVHGYTVQVASPALLDPDIPGPDPGPEPLHRLPRAQHWDPDGSGDQCDQADPGARGEGEEGGPGHSPHRATGHWVCGGQASGR